MFFGWLGAICFAICAVPQALLSFRQGHSDGVSWGFLSLWMLGEISMLIYILPKRDMPLIVNYVFNILFISIIFYYKFFPNYKKSNREM